jgi:hypothetical protein
VLLGFCCYRTRPVEDTARVDQAVPRSPLVLLRALAILARHRASGCRPSCRKRRFSSSV